MTEERGFDLRPAVHILAIVCAAEALVAVGFFAAWLYLLAGLLR